MVVSEARSSTRSTAQEGQISNFVQLEEARVLGGGGREGREMGSPCALPRFSAPEVCEETQ